MEKAKDITLTKLFTTSFLISLFTIGSGHVALPLYKRKVVEEKKWLNEEEMMDVMTIAQCSPGAIVVNLAVSMGYKLRKVPGVFAMVLGVITPPLLLMMLIQGLYSQLIDNPLVVAVFRGMNAAVSAVLVNIVISMISEIKDKKLLCYSLMAVAFVLVFYVKLHVIWVMSIGILFALLISWRERK